MKNVRNKVRSTGATGEQVSSSPRDLSVPQLPAVGTQLRAGQCLHLQARNKIRTNMHKCASKCDSQRQRDRAIGSPDSTCSWSLDHTGFWSLRPVPHPSQPRRAGPQSLSTPCWSFQENRLRHPSKQTGNRPPPFDGDFRTSF